MDNSMFTFIDLIIIVCGGYLVYGAVQLKQDGTLPGSLWNKDLPLRKCRDLPAFTAYMFPRLIVCGVAVAIDGVLGFLVDRYEGLQYLTIITMILVVVIQVGDLDVQ